MCMYMAWEVGGGLIGKEVGGALGLVGDRATMFDFNEPTITFWFLWYGEA